jgi:hypothetical protein
VFAAAPRRLLLLLQPAGGCCCFDRLAALTCGSEQLRPASGEPATMSQAEQICMFLRSFPSSHIVILDLVIGSAGSRMLFTSCLLDAWMVMRSWFYLSITFGSARFHRGLIPCSLFSVYCGKLASSLLLL